MFKENTVFILGAGASMPYGYPSGKKLIADIIGHIERDEIYLPQDMQNRPNIKNKDDIYEFNQLEEFFLETCVDDFNDPLTEAHNAFFKGNISFTKIKLSKIDIFLTLKNALRDFDPVSIDSFLRDHHSYEVPGKIMIMYSLLKCEDISRFSYAGNHPDVGNWYSYLINDLLSGLTEPMNFCDNQLNIITFNYSVDLDYCLYQKLNSTEFLSDVTEELSSFLKSKVFHVYGQIWNDDIIKNYGKYYKKGTMNEKNMQQLLYSIKSKDQIKLIGQERKSENVVEQYKEIIKKAKNIIIIGFGFDRDNLDILGFPRKKSGYKQFFKGKRISYMDFNGKMKALFSQLSNLENDQPIPEKDKFSIIRSESASIVDAYQNDFKIFLYDD